MEDGAVDAFRAILGVNEALEAVDYLHKLIGVVLLAIAGVGKPTGAINTLKVVGVYAAILGADVLRPTLIPAIRNNAGQDLLNRKEGAVENEGSPLRINAVGREEHIPVRSAGLEERTINGQTADRNLTHSLVAQVLQSLLGPLVDQVGVDSLQHLDDVVVVLPFDDQLG